MLDKIISGGQTGADQAGWRAARAFGITTGGWLPRGFLTEDGLRPELAVDFNATELLTADYPSRTRANVSEAEATLWFGATDAPGARSTLRACQDAGKPYLIVPSDGTVKPSMVATWIAGQGFQTLNVAGNRESKAGRIGAKVERFLGDVFRRLGHGRT